MDSIADEKQRIIAEEVAMLVRKKLSTDSIFLNDKNNLILRS